MASDWDTPHTLGDAERKRVYEKDGKKSVLFDVEGEEMWVPEKCIHDNSDVWCDSEDDSGTLVVRLWWAQQKGYV